MYDVQFHHRKKKKTVIYPQLRSDRPRRQNGLSKLLVAGATALPFTVVVRVCTGWHYDHDVHYRRPFL